MAFRCRTLLNPIFGHFWLTTRLIVATMMPKPSGALSDNRPPASDLQGGGWVCVCLPRLSSAPTPTGLVKIHPVPQEIPWLIPPPNEECPPCPRLQMPRFFPTFFWVFLFDLCCKVQSHLPHTPLLRGAGARPPPPGRAGPAPGLLAPTAGDCLVYGRSIRADMAAIRRSLGLWPWTLLTPV